jgi:acetyl-CoA C-acetyltransferase
VEKTLSALLCRRWDRGYALAQAWFHVASGLFDTALVVCEEKMSSCQRMQAAFLTIFDRITEQPLKPNLLWIFALEQTRYMETYGITIEEIARVSVKNKRNALNHPAAQLGAEVTIEEVLASEVMAWPVHRLMVSPTSDGAAAIVIAAEEIARRSTGNPVWIQGVGWCLDTAYWTNRDLAYPDYVEKAAWMAYHMAGVKEPRKEINIAEPYDPFAYKELHHLEGLQLAPRPRAGASRRRCICPRR